MINNKLKQAYFLFASVLVGAGFLLVFDGNRWVIVACLVVALGLSWFLGKSFLTYISQMVQLSNQALNKEKEGKHEISLQLLNELSQNQVLIAEKFKISAELIGNLAQPEKLDSAKFLGQNDPIAQALESIKKEMQQVKAEDEMRAWTTQGLARFGEILRNKLEIKEYAHNIISHLIKYLGANQGGIYIENLSPEGERYLELTSFYAYNKRKYLEDKIYPGIGLLGQCMLEQDFIYITDVPDDYIKITSGLGESTPNNIVVAPLLFNETFCGAIEIASFEVLKPYQMDFLRKVCEDIASEIASLKNVAHTKKLLEESNMLAQELQSREEVMKQSMEELAATQEEMVHKQAELSGIIHAIDSTLAT
ncbi:MAG: GAF domain-containing protein, partial [Cytophagales bacterium]|nr:GAF domain-containing protein [Cytophagales bacterium]